MKSIKSIELKMKVKVLGFFFILYKVLKQYHEREKATVKASFLFYLILH